MKPSRQNTSASTGHANGTGPARRSSPSMPAPSSYRMVSVVRGPYRGPCCSPYHSPYHSPLGPMILAAVGDQLVGVWFEGQKHQPDVRQWPVQADTPVLLEAARQLDEYFAGQREHFDLPLGFPKGTVFQQSVWQALLRIPYGSTQSYAAVSQAIGKPAAIRAVGTAIGRNPLSIVVPCHRVLGSHGALTGYAGGLERKVALLQTEKMHAKPNPNPTSTAT